MSFVMLSSSLSLPTGVEPSAALLVSRIPGVSFILLSRTHFVEGELDSVSFIVDVHADTNFVEVLQQVEWILIHAVCARAISGARSAQ